MKYIHVSSLFVLLLLGVALMPLRPHVRAQAQRPLLVIVASDTGFTDISAASLRRAFEAYPTEYRSGKRLLPINHPVGSGERTRFDRTVLGLSPDEVGLYWVDQRIRGSAQPPRTLASAELAVRVVASFPGAITYTDASLLRPDLKVLTIDGKSPTDRDYLLSR